MIKIITEILILAPFFFIAYKLGEKEATKILEEKPFLKHYKLLVEFFFMLLFLGFFTFFLFYIFGASD